MTSIATIPIAELAARGLLPHSAPVAFYILVVDQDRLTADALANVLRATGYGVIAAYDSETALEIARVAPPELLLAELCMRGVSGLEFSHQLLRLAPDCKVLLLSEGSYPWLDSLLGLGKNFVLFEKPIAPEQLLAEVSKLRMQSISASS